MIKVVEQEVKMRVIHAHCPVCCTEMLLFKDALPDDSGRWPHSCPTCGKVHQLRHQYPRCEIVEITDGSLEEIYNE